MRADRSAAILLTLLVVGPNAEAQAPGAASSAPEILAEVRIHGNYATPDAEVLRLAGLALGQDLGEGELERIVGRLRSSGRFESVEVRKRSRSLTDTDLAVLVILVREHPTAIVDTPPLLRPIRKAVGGVMFLPMLNYADGYGFTYGVRASFVDVLARDGRVSVPLTWGGTKRAAVELDQPLGRGPLTRLQGGVAISRRRNPHFRLDDERVELWAGARRDLGKLVRVEFRGGLTQASLGALEQRFGTWGADLSLDTRGNPAFPRNAVFATVGWEAIALRRAATIARTRGEARGYVGLAGQAVLSVRARYERADRAMPPYLQPLLGGAETLRGHRAGAFAGDNLLVSSVELRMPLTSPLGVALAGVTIFADSGAAYAHGEPLRTARFRHGAGAGVFLVAPLVQINLDVARGLGGGTRIHLTSGFRF